MAVKKVFIRTLGCPKNTADSEQLAVRLHKAGVRITAEEDEADTVIINTCAFINDALDESLAAVMESAGRKKRIILAGCLPGRYGNGILSELPEASASFGPYELDGIVEHLTGRSPRKGPDRSMLLASGPYNYVKISDGCDRRCSFCTIPSIKGRYWSQDQDNILSQVRQLARQGAREIVLVGQDLTAYGSDRGRNLAHLLRKIVGIPGDFHVRLLYLYPTGVTRELVKIVSGEEKIHPYFDMPVQHSSDRILKAMRRGHGHIQIQKAIDLIRGIPAPYALRTTVITGFPGEGKKEFAELYRFIEANKFNHLGAFAYSSEDGTVASGMRGQVRSETREKRRDQIMELQREISGRHLAGFKGMTLDAVIDSRTAGGSYTARNWYFAPEIDGTIHSNHNGTVLERGRRIRVTINRTDSYDLHGTISGY